MRFYRLLLLLLCFCFLSGLAGAVENLNQSHIKHVTFSAPSGSSLSGVEMYDLDPNSNTSIILNNYGQIYNLQVNATKNYLFWWNFDISLTSPNGSVQTTTLRSSAPFANNYDLFIQYYWMTKNGTFDTIFDLDLYTGLLPLNCMLNDWNPLHSQALQFTEITADSDSFYDICVFAVTNEEFAKQESNSITGSLSEGVKDLFSWSWDMIVDFIGSIPYIGSYLASVLLITAMFISGLIFYLKLLFIDYPETTFLTSEFFILSYAFSKKGSFWRKINSIVNIHIKIIELCISVSQALVNLFSSLVQMVASILFGLKPV